MKTAIIGGGTIEAGFAASFIIEKDIDCIIAADKGLQFCYEQNLMPDYILGDYDSVDPKILAWFKDRSAIPVTVFPAEKDDTDGALAFQKALEIGSDRIYFLGALGGRMDHAIANIHLLKTALDYEWKDIGQQEVSESMLNILKNHRMTVDAYIVDSQNMISLVKNRAVLRKEEQFGKYVSFLPFTDCVEGLCLEGFKYPLENYRMVIGKSTGVSNEIVEEEARISLRTGLLLMIQSRDGI